MIWKFYRYMFYQTYVQQVKVWWGFGFPEQTSTIGLTLVLFTYFLSILMAIKIIFGFDMFDFFAFNSQVAALFIGFLMLFVHHFLFLYNARYKKIIKEFKKESVAQKRKGQMINRIYVYGSLVLFVALGNILFVSAKYNFTIIGYIKVLLFHRPS